MKNSPLSSSCRSLCVCAKSPQSCLTLCDPMGCSPPGSSVHGILQARILEWVAVLEDPPGDLPNPGIEPTSLMFPALAGSFFTTRATWEALLSLCSIYRFQGKTRVTEKQAQLDDSPTKAVSVRWSCFLDKRLGSGY